MMQKEENEMKNPNNVRALKKNISSLKKGETIYINSIGLTINAIEYLRECIQEKVLLPYREEVEKSYKDVESVMNGKVIFPQMTYIRQ